MRYFLIFLQSNLFISNFLYYIYLLLLDILLQYMDYQYDMSRDLLLDYKNFKESINLLTNSINFNAYFNLVIFLNCWINIQLL